MIVYHPIHDVNHCLYRGLLILESSIHDRIDWDLFRLLDFYILFPHLLKEISPFPSSLRAFKKIVSQIPDSYEQLPNSKRILFDLEQIQNAAVSNLVAKSLVSVADFEGNMVKRTEEMIPGALSEKLNNDPRREKEWFRLVVNELPLVELDGKQGLKARSKLMEYRYDG